MVKIILIAILLTLLLSDWKMSFGNGNNTNSNFENYYGFLSKIKVPKKLEFCGEVVSLDNPILLERAEREFYINLQSPAQIILYLKRSARFFPLFDSIFKKHNIPEDMKYLAVAESGLQNVVSPKLAHGIWQFIPSTATEYKLQVDEFVDERLNIYKSTEAACRYLRQAYDRFGSWSLAAAAYNMGFTNLADNIQFQGSNNYFELFLNEETWRFVFRILIIKELMVNHKKYGFDIPPAEYYHPIRTKKIVWKDEIPNLAEWAREQGTTYIWVKYLNPWILKRKLPKPKDYYLIEIPDIQK
ncbi:MAG: lytic transglycosylase domain-containing protein [Ignavibacteria bacterium]|nr:lytic transglycosylase domain-containing protein [Ignavibacteria bacterium]